MIKLLLIAPSGAPAGELSAVRRAIEASDLAAIAEIIEQAPGEPLPAGIACILVDGSAAGIAIIRELRTARNATPIIFVSADSDDETIDAAVAAGATDFLAKNDLTPRRVAVRIRFATRAMHGARVREEILAIVSHDLRSPLHAIGLACEALRGQEDRNATDTRYIAAIERAAQRAERLITDLLEANAIENGAIALHMHPIDAAAVVRQAASDHELLIQETKARIATIIPPEPVLVHADRDRVLQVLGNLIGNAIKHARGSAIELRLERIDGEARIAVRDHGPGISDRELPHIFDRYWAGRDKRGGSGLGLAIAKGIVDAHGGKLIATSKRAQGDNGAELMFTLPLVVQH